MHVLLCRRWQCMTSLLVRKFQKLSPFFSCVLIILHKMLNLQCSLWRSAQPAIVDTNVILLRVTNDLTRIRALLICCTNTELATYRHVLFAQRVMKGIACNIDDSSMSSQFA